MLFSPEVAPRYAVIIFTAQAEDGYYVDIGPVLVKTYNYLTFYFVRTNQPVYIALAYEALRWYPPETGQDLAVMSYANEYGVLMGPQLREIALNA